jgi:hypothetical protein
MRRIGVDERRARLATRHHLIGSSVAATPTEAARGVVALHATDPATVFLSVHARTAPVEIDAIERALYEERSLMRMLAMRRTMFVVPADVAPALQASCTKAVAVTQRRKYTQFIEAAGIGDSAWLAEVEDATVAALAARGEATGAELSKDEPRLRSRVMLSEGKTYAAATNITTWVLFMLAAEGRIVRGRPRGSWTSSQWRWLTTERWFPDGLPDLPVEEARVALVRLWLAAFGPGTLADLRWWTGWTAAHVKQALTAIRPVEVDLDGTPGLVLPGDEAPTAPPEPWVSLLPALDATPMGWQGRDWFLGPHAPRLFDRSGNIGPTIWCDGRIVGGWAHRPDGDVAYQLLEDVGREATSEIEAAAARLTKWIGPIRVIPRFRTPLDRELAK